MLDRTSVFATRGKLQSMVGYASAGCVAILHQHPVSREAYFDKMFVTSVLHLGIQQRPFLNQAI